MICYKDTDQNHLAELLARFELRIEVAQDGSAIPGSFWGAREAGLIANCLYVRPDTPLHSILHEACHYICMDAERRAALNTNAGGDYDEENAVCYLQILLADFIPDFGREQAFSDMDGWGYSFRLGSARAWFEGDAEDACAWLERHAIINRNQQPQWRLRE